MLRIKESFVNKTEGHLHGETEWYEAFTDDRGELFRSLQQEYGRCTGKVRQEPGGRAVGWVFEKKRKYTDCNKHYIAETWVIVEEDEVEAKIDKYGTTIWSEDDLCLSCQHLLCSKYSAMGLCSLAPSDDPEDWPCAFDEDGIAVSCPKHEAVSRGTQEEAR
jgi:hypothetical protein